MIISPQEIIEGKHIKLSEYSAIQQSGIDVSVKSIYMLTENGTEEMFLPTTLPANSIFDFVCHEYVEVPVNAAALLIVRSSLNRRGAFVTTGLYDNGFCNYVGGILRTTLPFYLEANQRIAQIVFIRSESNTIYQGRYQDASIQKKISL